eukprot:XP_017950338.1 PREDICTED: uncharacterized protein LOC101732623 [Xenopus tropicalis]
MHSHVKKGEEDCSRVLTRRTPGQCSCLLIGTSSWCIRGGSGYGGTNSAGFFRRRAAWKHRQRARNRRGGRKHSKRKGPWQTTPSGGQAITEQAVINLSKHQLTTNESQLGKLLDEACLHGWITEELRDALYVEHPHWPIVKTDAELTAINRKRVRFGYKRNKNLKELLSSADPVCKGVATLIVFYSKEKHFGHMNWIAWLLGA